MNETTLTIYLMFALGVLAKVVLPYLSKWVHDKELKFDPRYLVGQLLSVGMLLIAEVLSDGFLLELAGMSFLTAFVTGWGIPAVGREVQKLLN